jgi:hypothetical protein
MECASSMGGTHSLIAKQTSYRPGDMVPTSNIFHSSPNIFWKDTMNKDVINCLFVPTQRTQCTTLPPFFLTLRPLGFSIVNLPKKNLDLQRHLAIPIFFVNGVFDTTIDP